MKHTNPFVFIVQIVVTLLLIPVDYDDPGQQASIYAIQPTTNLATGTSIAQMRTDIKENWIFKPTSSTISAVAGHCSGSLAALQDTLLWSLKSGRNLPRAIGHGNWADMKHTNPFVFIVQIVVTLLLIPVDYDDPGQQASIYAIQPTTNLATGTSTAQMRTDIKKIGSLNLHRLQSAR
ncbi:hypothetical protein MTO96_013079 [Rhipicephalus appendiculatus]